MSSNLNIRNLPHVDEIQPGDFVLVEIPEGSRILDFKNFIISKDNITFATELSGMSTNIDVLLARTDTLTGALFFGNQDLLASTLSARFWLSAGSGMIINNVKLTNNNDHLIVHNHLSAAGVVYASGGNSDQWGDTFTVTNAGSANWTGAHTQVAAYSASWLNTYNTTKANSGGWENTESTVRSSSASWGGESSKWTEPGGSITHLTNASNKLGIGSAAPSEKLSVAGNISASGLVKTLDDGTSQNWFDTYSTTAANSGDWENVETVTRANSGDWGAAATSLGHLPVASGAWWSSYSNLSANSGDWNNNETVTRANSADWENTYTKVLAESGDWENTWTRVNANSSKWENTHTVVLADSGDWNNTETVMRANSGDWNNNETVTRANSADWENTYTRVYAESGDWQNTESTVRSNSSTWAGGSKYTSSASFETTDGVITFTRSDASTFTVSIDGRYPFLKSALTNTYIPVYTTTGLENSVIRENSSAIGIGGLPHTSSILSVYGTISGQGFKYGDNAGENSTDWKNMWTRVSTDSATWDDQRFLGHMAAGSAKWWSSYNAVSANSGDWENAWTSLNANSADWNNTETVMRANSGDWNNTDTKLRAESGDWENTWTIVNANSAGWEAAETTVTNLNSRWSSTFTVMLANSGDWNNTETTLRANSGDWENVWTTVNTDSADWNNTDTTLRANSGDWDNTESTLRANSGDWDNTESTLRSNSGDWDNTETVTRANSGDWNNTETVTRANSGDWENAWTTVNTDSADWNNTHSKLGSISGVWTNVNVNSADWENTYTRFINVSAGFVSTQTTVYNNSGDWENAWTSLNANSADWSNTETVVRADSAAWVNSEAVMAAGSGAWWSTHSEMTGSSANWDNVWTSVNTDSADWNNTETVMRANSGDWDNVETVTRANSATWEAGASLCFKTVSAAGNTIDAGQTVVADDTTDSITLSAMGGVVINTHASTDVVTISANVEVIGSVGTAGDGLDLGGSEFSVDTKSNGGLVIESTELAVDLGASSITGTLAVGDGGTGATTLTTGGILLGNGTGAIQSTAVLTNGQILIGDGSGNPTVATITGTANEVDITNGAGTITIGQPDDVTIGSDLTVTDSLIVDTDTLVVNRSGYTDKVGIGLTTPSTLLHLSGGDSELLRIESNDPGNSAEISMHLPSGVIGTLYSDKDETILQRVRGTAVQNNKIKLESDGDIYLNAPSDKKVYIVDDESGTPELSILASGTSKDPVLSFEGSFTGTGKIYVDEDAGQEPMILCRTAADGSETVGISIADTGQVGIGTTIPSATLHVYDSSNAATVKLQSNPSDDVQIQFFDTSTKVFEILYDKSESEVALNASAGKTFAIGTNGATNRLTLDKNGNLAIAGDITITGDDIVMGTNTDGYMLVANGTNYSPVAISGAITIANTGVTTLAGTAISNLADTTLTSSDYLMFWDATDSALKKVDAGEVLGGGGTTYTHSWVDSSDDVLLRLTPSTGSAADIKIVSGDNITLTHTDANNFTISSTDTNDNDNTTYSISCVDGGDAASEKIRLTAGGSGSGTDDVTLAVGDGLSIARSGDTITFTNTETDTTIPDTDTTYALTAVDGDNTDEEKIVLTAGGDGSGSDELVLEAGTGLSIARDGAKITFTNTISDTTIPDTDTTYTPSWVDSGANAKFRLTDGGSGGSGAAQDLTIVAGDNITLTPSGTNLTIAAANDNTQLSTEQVQDIVGAMFTGNTETRIAATYQDGDGTIDLTVDNMSGGSVDGTGSAGSVPIWSDSDTLTHDGNNLYYNTTAHHLGIGKQPSYHLDVDAGNDATRGINLRGALVASGDITAFSTSDRRLKTNITPISDSLSKIDKISGVVFDWTDNAPDYLNGTDYGVIAQDVEQVLPCAVTERSNGYKAVNYEKMIPLMVECIKDLKQEVEDLREQLKNK